MQTESDLSEPLKAASKLHQQQDKTLSEELRSQVDSLTDKLKMTKDGQEHVASYTQAAEASVLDLQSRMSPQEFKTTEASSCQVTIDAMGVLKNKEMERQGKFMVV